MRIPGTASHRGFDDHAPDVLRTVFAQAVAVLDATHAPYLLIGGLASAALGRPRCSADVDVLVKPEDASFVLDAFGEAGFATEETNPHWLYKATRHGVLIDLLFRGPRDIFLDDEMLARSRVASVMGQTLRVAPPEDLIVMKALIHDEETPRHWHDALALIARAEVDWDYLVQRASKGSRRVLSLLLYAVSIDLIVPARAIEALYQRIAGDFDAAR